ncbi:hypothetical protein CEXT_361551 [Caerostris extrusa]|uniref:Uncharacterized protein n=1 Tax=Caerostris extrusa TaxID=172846 RepID=A0AAV4WGE1_CAEEX|nr:hypothetical protein CEXT_361551 [Caerostris extrusa]
MMMNLQPLSSQKKKLNDEIIWHLDIKWQRLKYRSQIRICWCHCSKERLDGNECKPSTACLMGDFFPRNALKRSMLPLRRLHNTVESVVNFFFKPKELSSPTIEAQPAFEEPMNKSAEDIEDAILANDEKKTTHPFLVSMSDIVSWSLCVQHSPSSPVEGIQSSVKLRVLFNVERPGG